MLAGQLIAGGWLSLTVTVKLHVALFPAASVTWNTFVVTPTGKAAPLVNPAICVVTVGGAHVLTPVTWSLSMPLYARKSLVVTMLLGQLIAGGCESLIVTLKLQLGVL